MEPTKTPSASLGSLIVKVTTAQGAIPLEGASVHIRGGSKEASGVLHSLITNRDGQTPIVLLPTPPLVNSQSPDGGIPFALYSIDVSKEGYLPLSFEQVPIFPAVLSIQPAVMIPAPEFFAEGR